MVELDEDMIPALKCPRCERMNCKEEQAKNDCAYCCWDATEFPKMLPVVDIGGEKYFKDDRLSEFRAVHNPHDRILFKDYEMALVFKSLLEAGGGSLKFLFLLNEDDEIKR